MPLSSDRPQICEAKTKQSDTAKATVVASYAALLAVPSDQLDRRMQMISDVVQDCAARHGHGMHAAIRAIGIGHDDAEESVQETLMIWWQRLHNGEGLPAPQALAVYLKTVARNAALRHVKRKDRRRKAEAESARRRFGAEQSTALSEAALSELSDTIDRILEERCTPIMRRVFDLRRHEKTYKEIAENLGAKNADAIRGVMHKAVKILLEELTRLGWDELIGTNRATGRRHQSGHGGCCEGTDRSPAAPPLRWEGLPHP